MVLESQNANVVEQDAIVNGVWEARHEIVPHIRLNNAPPVRGFENYTNRPIGSVEELSPQREDSPLVKLRRLDEFRLGIGVIN